MKDQISYFGKLRIESVANLGDIDSFKAMTEDDVKFVHYPDCQQLSVWLPDLSSLYTRMTIKDKNTNHVIFEEMVSHILNGTIKIVLDTLFISPGHFVVKIESNHAFCHKIYFTKYAEGEELPEIIVEQPTSSNEPSSPIVYRDGFGNIIKYDNDRWREIYY